MSPAGPLGRDREGHVEVSPTPEGEVQDHNTRLPAGHSHSTSANWPASGGDLTAPVAFRAAGRTGSATSGSAARSASDSQRARAARNAQTVAVLPAGAGWSS